MLYNSTTTEARWWCSLQKKIHYPALCFSYLYIVTHRVGESMYFYLIFIPSKFVSLRENECTKHLSTREKPNLLYPTRPHFIKCRTQGRFIFFVSELPQSSHCRWISNSQIPLGSCQNAESDSVGPGWRLRLCILNTPSWCLCCWSVDHVLGSKR